MALNIVVIFGSVRSERLGIKAARFVERQFRERGHTVTLVDPLEYRLPLLDKMYKEYGPGTAPEPQSLIGSSGVQTSPARPLNTRPARRSSMSDTREYFDQVADQWDEMREKFFGEGVRRAVMQSAQVGPGMLVADVGTGTGFLAEAALATGARVIGIDISDGMLAQVTSRFAGRAFEGRRGDSAALPLADAEADAVVANMVLHHAEDPPAAIREMARTLKPGGRLVITDADSHTHEWLRTEQHDCWLGFDRTDIDRWFRNAGLQGVSVGDTQEVCSPTSECGTKAAISIFIASGSKPDRSSIV